MHVVIGSLRSVLGRFRDGAVVPFERVWMFCVLCMFSGDFPCYFLFGCKESSGLDMWWVGLELGTPDSRRRHELLEQPSSGCLELLCILLGFLLLWCGVLV